MFKILNRYILKEIGIPFLLTLFVFTFVLLIGKILQIMEMMVNKGIHFLDVAKLVLFIMPSFLAFTMPMSFLIAVLIGLGRLSGDNEITVMRASGMSLYQLSKPVAIAALIIAMMTALVGIVAPHSNLATKGLLFQIVQQKASIGIKEKIFNDDFQGLVLYADRIAANGDFMEGILISDSRLASEPTTIIARRGYLVSNPRTMTVTLRLLDGSIHAVDSNFQKYKLTEFSSYDVNLDLKQAIAGGEGAFKKGSIDMTIGELLKNIEKRDRKPEDIRDMIIELHKKVSVPLSCLVFALLAVPFGIVSKRSGKSRGFTVGLLIVVVYYTLQLAGEALGETGKIHPVLAVWAPNMILGVAGLFFFFRSAREKSLDFFNLSQRVGSLSDRCKRRQS
jgi:lipopolysaccharide export system permease protein